ncbi:carboxypeptidase regulatory-like domain-containing protein [Patescibacteria group bacterium]
MKKIFNLESFKKRINFFRKPVGLILIIGIFLIASVITIVISQKQKGENLDIRSKAMGEITNTAVLLIEPERLRIPQGQVGLVDVLLDTGGAEVIGVDMVIEFDNQILELSGITPIISNIMYLPVAAGGTNLDETRVLGEANSLGKIEFGLVAFQDVPSLPLVGQNSLVSLEFRGKAVGITNLSFGFDNTTPDLNHDCNVTVVTEEVVDDILFDTIGATIFVVSTETPTTTLTPTVTLPTITLTPTATATPTPINQEGLLIGQVDDNLTGYPIAGAKVVVSIPGVKGKKGQVAELATGKWGLFETELDPGRYIVTASYPSYETNSQEVTIYLGIRTALELSLNPKRKSK